MLKHRHKKAAAQKGWDVPIVAFINGAKAHITKKKTPQKSGVFLPGITALRVFVS